MYPPPDEAHSQPRSGLLYSVGQERRGTELAGEEFPGAQPPARSPWAYNHSKDPGQASDNSHGGASKRELSVALPESQSREG